MTTITILVRVKPLVWEDMPDIMRSGVYRIQKETYGQGLPFWSWGSTILGRGDDIPALIAAANAHHAAQVLAMVEPVVIDRGELINLLYTDQPDMTRCADIADAIIAHITESAT